MLILPGWSDSGPEHWQTLWEKEHPEFKRVVQKDWINVNPEDWLGTLDLAISQNPKPVVLVAHSLGCILVAHWAKFRRPGVRGAFLVAPADVDRRETCPVQTWGFGPIPLEPLPFKSIVIASADDPFVDLARAQHFAKCWNSDFVSLGLRGHINAASNLGSWPEGQELLSKLFEEL